MGSKHGRRRVFLVHLLVLIQLVSASPGPETQYSLRFLAPPSLLLFSVE